jgi:DNA-binding MarR family transcriptional regulator
MASPNLAEDSSFGVLIHHVRIGLIRHLEQTLIADGIELNFSQFRVLKALSRCSKTTPSELARSVGHDAGALTRMLDRLQDKGYVKRNPRDEDRRVVDICLTEAGRALWSEIRKSAERVNEFALSTLESAERQQLIAVLTRVRATLEHGSPERLA